MSNEDYQYRDAETGHFVTREFALANPTTTVRESTTIPRLQTDDASIEQYCRVMHDAYEAAAPEAGWETNIASRTAWDEVPEANKQTMRAAVRALVEYINS